MYSKTAQIVFDYLNKDASDIVRLRKWSQKHMKTIQFVYSRCFLEIYSFIDNVEVTLKVNFCSNLTFKLWKDKKKFSTISTNEKKSEDEQPLEKKTEDEKLMKQLQEKKLKRKALAEKKYSFKRGIIKAS